MAEKLTGIELGSVLIEDTKPRTLGPICDNLSKEDDIETTHGPIHVIVRGDRSKTPILTYHDIGLNSTTCFQGFFNSPDMQPILKHFCVYHVNAPGQHDGALPLPQGGRMRHSESDKLLDHMCLEAEVTAEGGGSAGHRASLGYTGDASMVTNYQYPTMDQLAEMIFPILQFYGIKTFIGFGMGAGSNILARFALAHPERVEGILMMNCSSTKSGWTEWGLQKLNARHLRNGTVSTSVEDYFLWHWLGEKTRSTNYDLNVAYSEALKAVNPQNLAYFIDSYIKRSDLGLVRELDPMKKKSVRNLKCQVLLCTGDTSPHLSDTVNTNGRLDPEVATWIKYECGGMPSEECPSKLVESFRLFLQGMGYIPSLSQTKIIEARNAMSKSSQAPAPPKPLPARSGPGGDIREIEQAC